MGGSDDRSNLVQLKAEEHFVAHQLLHKIHPGVRGLAFAMLHMTGNPYGHRNNKAYGWIRRKVGCAASARMRELHQDPEYRSRHQESMRKLRADPEYVMKMAESLSRAHRGRIKSPEERANIATAGRNRKPRVFSEQARCNMAAARRKTWEERRASGTASLIAAKTVATRRRNGSYEFSQEWKDKIGESCRGRAPHNKGKVTSSDTRVRQSEAAKERWSRVRESRQDGPAPVWYVEKTRLNNAREAG